MNKYLNKKLEESGFTVSTHVDPDNNDTTIYSDLQGKESPEIEASVKGIIKDYDPREDAQAEAIAIVKEKAGQLIIDKMPAWKQRNLIAEALDIVNSETPDKGRLAEIQVQWGYVKKVREQSGIEEAIILAETDYKKVNPNFKGMEAI